VSKIPGDVSSSGADERLLYHISYNIPGILRQEMEALQLMLEGRLDAYGKGNSRFDRNHLQAARHIQLLGHKTSLCQYLRLAQEKRGATLLLIQALESLNSSMMRFFQLPFHRYRQ